MALTITTQVTLNKEMVVGSRLSMIVTLEGLLNIPIPCFDIFEGTLLGSWCQQYSSEIISVTIFVQWIRCGRVAWDGGGVWHLWGELARRPSLQLAPGTRFITSWPWLFQKPWFFLSIFFSNFGWALIILMKRSLREWRAFGDHLQGYSRYPLTFPQGFYPSILSSRFS